MLTFQITPSEIKTLLPMGEVALASHYVQKLCPKANISDGCLRLDSGAFQILTRTTSNYPKYGANFQIEDKWNTRDGFIVTLIAGNYSEFYIFGMAKNNLDPQYRGKFHFLDLKTFGLWNSVEVKRRGF